MAWQKIKAPDVADARRQAGDVLAHRGNRLLLIEALIVLLIPFGLYFFLNMAFSSLSELFLAREMELPMVLLTVLYPLLLLLYTLFFTVPLIFGLLRLAHGMICEEDVVLADLFSPFFTRKGYRCAVRLSWTLLWRAAVGVLAIAAIAFLVPVAVPDPIGAVLLCGILILAVVILDLVWLLRQFPLFAVAMYQELQLPDVRRGARTLTWLCPGGGVRFFLYFVPQICLGLLTFGIFLIWEVLPRMCISYLLYCNRIHDKMTEIGGIENYE